LGTANDCLLALYTLIGRARPNRIVILVRLFCSSLFTQYITFTCIGFHLHRVDRSVGFIRDWLVVFVITDHTQATAYTMPMLLFFFNFLEGVVALGEFGRGSVIEL
jgi:hypothetical protein